MKKTLEQRFWEKVNKNGSIILDTPCWEWTANTNTGYGILTIEERIKDLVNGKLKTVSIKRSTIYAHRYSFELHTGQKCGDLYACHRCDNKKCVNPDHLFLGTAADNTLDMCLKNRSCGKTTNEIVSIWRDQSRNGVFVSQLPFIDNIPRHIVHGAIRGNTYKHCKTPPAEPVFDKTERVASVMHKLSFDDVLSIWNMRLNAYHGLQKDLARQYGVDSTTINFIWYKKYVIQKLHPELFIGEPGRIVTRKNPTPSKDSRERKTHCIRGHILNQDRKCPTCITLRGIAKSISEGRQPFHQSLLVMQQHGHTAESLLDSYNFSYPLKMPYTLKPRIV